MLTIIIPCYNEKNINQSAKIYRLDIKNNSINSWQGRLCRNTPFICSYYKLEVKKKIVFYN